MHRRKLAALLIVGLTAHVALGQDASSPALLKAGDPAPPLVVGKWVKGAPVAKLEPGKLYVVEFWATWCVPCKVSIPHLTEMAKKNPQVTFIGSDIWEKDESLVEPFVKKMGDAMDYHIATDSTPGKQGAMATTWMKAAGRSGIPTAFVIGKDEKIAWIGHPIRLEPVLEKVEAGTYDVKAEAEKQAKLDNLNKQLTAAAKANDVNAVLSATEQIKDLDPTMVDAMTSFEFNFLLKHGHADEARSRANTLVSTSNSPGTLNVVAWTYATEPSPAAGDLAIARTAIDRGVGSDSWRRPRLARHLGSAFRRSAPMADGRRHAAEGGRPVDGRHAGRHEEGARRVSPSGTTEHSRVTV